MKGSFRLSHLALVTTLFLSPSRFARADFFVFWPSRVFRYNENTGALISQTPKNFDTETIDAAAIGPDGDLYGLGNSMGFGAVFRFDGTTGAYKSKFINDAGSIPECMEFGPDGDLYVSEIYSPDWSQPGTFQVNRFDGKTGAAKEPLIPTSENVQSGGAMTFGPDGNLYVVQIGGAILRFDGANGQFIDRFAEPFTPTNSSVSVIRFGTDENLYALSSLNHVYRIDSQNRTATDFIDASAAGMNSPRKLLVGPEGDIYLADVQPLDVWRFNGRTGASKGIFIKGEVPPYGAGWITAMAFSGPRVSISRGKSGPCVQWPNTFGNFELQSRAGWESPWQPITETPERRGSTLSVELNPSSNNLIFRLVKK
jgi:hypothetical protein